MLHLCDASLSTQVANPYRWETFVKSTFKRAAAAGASAALIASGMTVAAGAGVAGAQEAKCEPQMNLSGASGLVIEQSADKSSVAPGGTVTYQTKVSRSGANFWMLGEIGDFHDPALTLEDSRLNVFKVPGGQTWGATHLQNDPAKNLYWEKGSGWDMTGGNYVILETTYRVSEDAEVGKELVSGVQAKPIGFQTSQEWPDRGACVEIREKNPVESVTGSLDSAGLGSATGSADGSASGSQISSDPAGFIADIINQINLGKLIGLS